MKTLLHQFKLAAVLLFALILPPAVTLHSQSDTQPPQLVEFALNKNTVDVSAAPQTITAALHVTDDLSGIDLTTDSRLRVVMRSPSGQSAQGANVVQSGVVLDGTFPINVTVPQFSEPGTWTITVLLRDNIGNTATLTPAALAAAGFPSTVTVNDTNPDTTAPQLVAVAFSPTSVDVSAANVPVVVDLTVTDDVSGISTTSSGIDFILASPSSGQAQYLPWSEFHLMSGTINNGVWRATLTIPRYSQAGIWKITSVKVPDNARNQRVYTPSGLTAFGTSIQLAVSSSPSDTTPPQLTNVTFNPDFINTAHSNTVHTQLTISDNLSGVSFAPFSGFLSPLYVQFVSPSGAQNASFFTFESTGVPPVSGTPLNGVWALDVTLPQFSETGTWHLSINVKDSAGNATLLSTAQLAALGFPTNLVVIQLAFTDDPLVPGTPIKAVHLSELRGFIDAARARHALGAFAYSEAVAPGTVIKASHLLEMRTALQQAYVAAGLTPPSYTTAPAAGVTVRAADINELRTAVSNIP